MSPEAQLECLGARPIHTVEDTGLTIQQLGDEWDKVAKAIRRLNCPSFEVKTIIAATNSVALKAAELRGSSTLDNHLVQQFNASADELIEKIKLRAVPDKSQAQAIRAINRFKGKVI